MTKNNTEIMNTILSKQQELNINEDIMDFIKNTLETAGHKSTTKNPNYIDEDTGIEMKFCSRHLQYEEITEYTQQKSGKFESCCDVALKQWRQYDKELKILEKLSATILAAGIDEEIVAHFREVQAAKDLRSGSYEYPTTEK